MTTPTLPEPNPLSGTEALADRVERNKLLEYLKQHTTLHFLKRWAWRLTGALFWLWVLTSIVQPVSIVTITLHKTTDVILALLALVGLQPPGAKAFGIVLRIGWILLITGFRPLHLLGLAFYVLAFPLSALFVALFREPFLEHMRMGRQTAAKRGLIFRHRRVRSRAAVTAALVAWFLLYGDSTSAAQLGLGASIALALFGMQVLRSFASSQVTRGTEPTFIDRVESTLYDVARTAAEDSTPKKRIDAASKKSLYGLARTMCRSLALLLRGQRGQLRAAAIVIMSYIGSLSALCLTAIAFWALVIQVFSAPTPLPYETLLAITMSHFLPGVAAPASAPKVPFWIDIGTSLTSWILFVVYLAAATASLGDRQKLMTERLKTAYRRFRLLTIVLGRVVRRLERHEMALPFQH